MEKELFSWASWDMLEELAFGFNHCVMLRDFGPLKTGEEYDSIILDYGRGLLIASEDESGTVEVEVKMGLVPITSEGE